MNIIACKFGGSSTADAACFRQIKSILDADPNRRYIVLSAPGSINGSPKVTDLLAAAWNGDEGALEAVVARFRAIAEGLGMPFGDEDAFDTLDAARAISRDALLSRGEYLCARLFSEYAGLPFADAASLVCFDGDGAVEVPRTLTHIRRLARRLPRAVIPGFYGTGPDGNIVTLPRNGSDITGALVAAGVGAAVYENWTDVPGLMTADPARNQSARVIPEITYAEMRRIAEGGAQVLHPDCLRPVESAGIPTRIRWTAHPETPGTFIA